MTKQNESTQRIKKPILVLNDANKFYLATQEIGESESGLFYLISLFLPVKDGIVMNQPRTEISAFDDSKSLSVHYETLKFHCQYHKQSNIAKMVEGAIKAFEQSAQKMIVDNENVK